MSNLYVLYSIKVFFKSQIQPQMLFVNLFWIFKCTLHTSQQSQVYLKCRLWYKYFFFLIKHCTVRTNLLAHVYLHCQKNLSEIWSKSQYLLTFWCFILEISGISDLRITPFNITCLNVQNQYFLQCTILALGNIS